MHRIPVNNLENSLLRLDRIMSRRRLSFNPYTVSDTKLLELVSTTGWGNEFDITQMVRMYFTRLRRVQDTRNFDGIYFTLGQSDQEIFIHARLLKQGITADDNLHHERCMLGKHILRTDEDIESLVGKTVFVSHTIRGHYRDHSDIVYRMHRLYGNISRDATTIRRSMCEAKLEMLQRVRDYPECKHYLDCNPTLFDFYSRINAAIELIKHFPDVGTPTE